MANTIDKLAFLFKESLEDQVLSRKERKELRTEITEASLSEQQSQVLLSRLRDLAKSRVSGQNGPAVIDWLYEATKILKSESAPATTAIHSYFSPGTSCREAICSQIRFARDLIRICVFTISDDEITEELLAAHRRGKTVRILSDNDKAYDLGSDVDRLAAAGIAVVKDRTRVHMHHKFALIDNDTLITGSYNWTRSAADHNYENIIVLKDAKAFGAYEEEFERLWRKMK